MTGVKEKRVIEILKDGKHTTIIIKNNRISKVIVEKKNELYVIFRSGNWFYYDFQNNIFIRPKDNQNYKIKSDTLHDKIKMYYKAWDIDIECENIWREALSLFRHFRFS